MSEAISNTIPVSQVQVGDYVLYRNGTHIDKERKFFRLKRIRELFNGTRVLCLVDKQEDREKEMTVMNKGEVTIKI